MKYLDENGLRRFWQKTKDYVDMNSGGSGTGGSATYSKMINKKVIELWTPADVQPIEDGEMFVAGETFDLYKNDINIGSFTVKDTSETERQTLAMIASQMGAQMSPVSCTYISSVDEWLNIFMAGEPGFLLATIDDANMGKIYLHYDNTTSEQVQATYSIKEKYSVPIDANFFTPKLIWSGHYDSNTDFGTDFILDDNYEKYEGYIILFYKEDSNQHIPVYAPRIDNVIHAIYNQSYMVADFKNLYSMSINSWGSWGGTYFIITHIYGCH